jgi:threonine aldolase
VESVVRADSIHYPTTGLISLENTHNKAGGTVFPLDEIVKIREIADRHNLPMHLDGARIFNAVIATGIEPEKWAAPFESISTCLSKGLGAPVGSVLLGSKDFIHEALYVRKRFGGAMRQAGILAAAGLYALENNVERLAEDHANARRLAEGVNGLEGFSVDLEGVHTNIVMIDVTGTGANEESVRAGLAESGVLVHTFGRGYLRVVTHLNISAGQIEKALEVFAKVAESL